MADYGGMPADRESLHPPLGGNRLFQLDLDEAHGKDAAYTAKPSLPGLLMTAQVVMKTWKKEQLQHAQGDLKRKDSP
jgi:hypothetical protein